MQHSGGQGRVTVFGSANEDLVLPVAQLPEVGATILADALTSGPGGKGANQAVAAAQEGAKVFFVGAVGRDERGDRVLGNLARHGIDAAYVQRVMAATGLAVVIRDEAGNNVIVVAPGANMACTPPMVERAIRHLTPTDVVVLQCEIPVEVIEHVIRRATAARATVILNLAPYVELDRRVLARLDLIVVNESEAQSLLDSRQEPMELAAQVRQLTGCPTIVTLGERGAVLSTPDGGHLHVPAVPVPCVRDTTGAGDVYVGSLAAKLAAGADVAEAMIHAGERAASSVANEGAQGAEALAAG